MKVRLICKISVLMAFCWMVSSCVGGSKKFHSAKLKENAKRENYESKGKNFAIASQGQYASQAGASMFNQGGNIVDAAVAISFVISVERPQSTGLGGGGFMMLHWAKNKKTEAVDFREKAPFKSHRDMYVKTNGEVDKEASLFGIKSVAVPGLVAGLIEIHKKYGSLPLEKVVQPAISLAENGFKIYKHLAFSINFMEKHLRKFPSSQKIFFNKKGEPLKEGDWLYQKDLAKTLRAIAKNGRDGFYKGFVAKGIVSTMNRYGGLVTRKDLNEYNVKWRKPVEGKFKNLKLFSMPPPSSGGIHVVQILNILENASLSSSAFDIRNIHFNSLAMQQAFSDRAKFLGDSDFVDVPIKGLTSKSYAKNIFSDFKNSARPSKDVEPGNPWPYNMPYESDETTHFSVIDGEGNAIASTQTINFLLGSGVVAEGTGIVLNDEMDDFAAQVGASNVFGAVGGNNNLIKPQKRPLSSMSPTLVFDKNGIRMALGSPSGTRIITCVSNTILNYLQYDLSLYKSVTALRYHHQWSPDSIRVDEPGFSSSIKRELENMGHKIEVKNLGCKVNAVAKEVDNLIAVSDPRGEGSALAD